MAPPADKRKKGARRVSEFVSCLLLDINPYNQLLSSLAEAEYKFYSAKVSSHLLNVTRNVFELFNVATHLHTE